MAGCKAQKAPAVPVTPQSSYSGPIVIDPVTRIEGHLRVEVEVDNGKVSNVWSSSQLFRGLETILKGRDPRDAQHFTQRSCGVCTYVHALASTRCVDNAVGVKIPENAHLVRNLVLSAQYLHDHIVHFYHLHALDWVDVTSALKADPAKAAKIANNISPRVTKAEDLKAVQQKLQSFVDSGQLGIFTNAYFLGGHEAYYLPPEVNLIATAHYLEALRLQVKAARAMAVFGAKNPHTQFTVVGGVTCYNSLTPERISEFKSLYEETRKFVEECYIPDLLAVAGYYKDWGSIGGCTNFLSFGEFGNDDYSMADNYIPQGVIMNRNLGQVTDFDPNAIAEHVKHSWYKDGPAKHPYEGVTEPQYTSLEDKDRYSWMKAPRYQGEAMEVGPLAHVLVAYARGHKDTVEAVDYVCGQLGVGKEALFSTLGRTAARGIETLVTARKMETWINQLAENVSSGNNDLYTPWEMPNEAEGVGFVNAPRGGLSHWVRIKNKKIENFQLVVPSTWNLGPRCGANKLGPVEEALMGTPVVDPERPVEILRTVHAFDPCIACGVHVIDSKTNKVHKFRVL
ncbi:nickel-dependent hydrogenase large subunit [Desulfohalobium retbaense]|uniref:Periplasmic [NiFe] hydrogenase, large subunit n=1 Tax=Desulfohalobium retbaense (strain ATCC 49708 / DSM 5692 / JCM 16813 / HR100) TaxID=485915 RepID=C8WZU3_DESRD|nr:nickel-dependent hydrogenase large subunit [Desulfohalobium retbaense]ACV67568.1 periplasmic [NiFe] hydrogenase, large subunit [Desulfohalobium retbaense DSM 5692]